MIPPTLPARSISPRRLTGRGGAPFLLALLLILWPATSRAQAGRIVLLKVDGLPADLVDRFVAQRDPRTGKSSLPWIDHVFYQQGTRLANFYVRGTSLSAPSWSMLETGQHLQIKGNVEFDRFTLRPYDYLNFFPFYINYAKGTRVDMPGVEVLDSLGIPLMVDAFPYENRYVGLQLYQRGVRWMTLGRSLKTRFGRNPKALLDEWTIGMEIRSIVSDQVERDVLKALGDPRIRYLDYTFSDFDHAAHHNQDLESRLYSLRKLDGVVGRIWTAIQESSTAADTVLVIASDHGFNADEHVFSQGFNLIKPLGSAAGGGHHVVTKRRLLLDYSLKGILPLTRVFITPAPDSTYLKQSSSEYPTATLDFDGNERAALQLRDSDLNLLQILLQQLQGNHLSPEMRGAMTEAFFQVIDRRRRQWQSELTGIREEMGALARSIENLRGRLKRQQKKWSQQDLDTGRDKQARRVSARLDTALAEHREYTEYARTLENLLALRPEGFDPARVRVEEVIAKRAMGDRNNIYRLQNYVTGLAPGGPLLAEDGTLDLRNSFHRVNYFPFLHELSVRNNVQLGLSSHPVDLLATRIAQSEISAALPPELRSGEDAVWVYGGPEKQALILWRQAPEGALELRYLPVSGLRQGEDGRIEFQRAEWGPDLPLKIWEDPNLNVPGDARAEFLDAWHTDTEWLRALHRTTYSNGLIGLQEHFARHDGPSPEGLRLSADQELLRRFGARKRRMVESDLLVLAGNHWNFDVRGFNPGGNHGSLFRVSTHATLMLAGGANTGVPRTRVVQEPYDSLSFVPTVFALMNLPAPSPADGVLPVAAHGCTTRFPGRIIRELIPENSVSPCAAPARRGVYRGD